MFGRGIPGKAVHWGPTYTTTHRNKYKWVILKIKHKHSENMMYTTYID
jgi:hypothetical protein